MTPWISQDIFELANNNEILLLQEMVIELITKPPVSQILKISTYTPSLAEIIPITFVERPPIPIAA
jgi:hypothetical protein